MTRASHTTRAAETRVNRPDAAPAAPPRVSPHAGTQGAPAAPHGGGRGSPVAWVGAVVEKLGEILASPLALLPVAARDAVGYLAAVTLFNALAVWAYMLIVHKPAEAPRGHEGPALHSAEPGDAPQGVEARTNPAEHAKATPEGAGSRAQQPDHAAPPHARTSEPRHH